MATKKESSTEIESGGIPEESALNELFVDELKDIYWAEKHLTKALPKMAKAATSEELKAVIEAHKQETDNHVQRLEDVFRSVGVKAVPQKWEAMEGLIKEGEAIIEDTEDGSVIPAAGLISAAQKIEHYEIASYGTLKTLALTFGKADSAELLDATLQEEKKTDDLLTGLAQAGINDTAAIEKNK